MKDRQVNSKYASAGSAPFAAIVNPTCFLRLEFCVTTYEEYAPVPTSYRAAVSVRPHRPTASGHSDGYHWKAILALSVNHLLALFVLEPDLALPRPCFEYITTFVYVIAYK